jgi:Asp-tRNA(Asn)/Glu-tRNA(Gln) amidotransferase A subunit family amidase
MVPAASYLAAQRFRRWFAQQVNDLLTKVDVVLAPATPFAAPMIGQREELVNGRGVATQRYLGLYTQPLSFAGVPVLTVPVPTGTGMPLGVQLVSARHGEAALLRLAAHLEAAGLTRSSEQMFWPRRAVR